VASVISRGFEDAIRFIVRAVDRADGNYSARIEIGTVTVEFDLTGAIDIKAERARLTKIATARKDLATAKVKVEDGAFMAKGAKRGCYRDP
jgi:valyl-tRNA synthetase